MKQALDILEKEKNEKHNPLELINLINQLEKLDFIYFLLYVIFIKGMNLCHLQQLKKQMVKTLHLISN